MPQKKYDVAILGAGPGGYPAAIKLAQAGKKVALIEAGAVGGTCLNRGCIPTKALIAYSEVLHHLRRSKEFGIDFTGVTIDFAKMSNEKDATVERLKNSLEGLLKSNDVDIIHGFGKFISPTEIKVVGQNGGQNSGIISATDIIIATGTEPKEIPAFA
ncbi:MAG TPA: FAD-dependent oxidoreductase, partial [Chlamydiales bacterium]|nr:FAD-dependent oxidoreductase [Chlamydiales bacterium]